jgi:hypothetical protein
MWQAVAAYLIVAGAAAWVVWSVLLPRALRARIGASLRRPAATAGSCGDCGCDKG